MAANGDTAALPAVIEHEAPLYQAIGRERSGRRTALTDAGLVKMVLTYWDQDHQKVMTPIVTRSTLDKITNTLEDEAVG